MTKRILQGLAILLAFGAAAQAVQDSKPTKEVIIKEVVNKEKTLKDIKSEKSVSSHDSEPGV